MKRTRWPVLAAVILFGFSLSGFANEDVNLLRTELHRSQKLIKQLMKRVDQLEVESFQEIDQSEVLALDIAAVDAQESRFCDIEGDVFELQDKVGERPSVRIFDADAITLGGFITQQFEVMIGDNDATASFNATQFELLLRAEVTDDISVFIAQGFLWEADESFVDPSRPTFTAHALRTPLIIGYVDYAINNNWDVEVGRYITPHGVINIEHFPPVLLDIRQPMFLRPFSGETIFPNFLSGIKINGRCVSDCSEFLFHAYSGVRTAGANRRATAFTSGLRGAWVVGWMKGLTLGGNYAYGQREPASSYHMLGADAYFDGSLLMLKSELFYTFEQGQDDRFAFYFQPGVKFSDKWVGFYRFDYLDDGTLSSQQNVFVEHTFGVNFLPCPTVRFRGEVIGRSPRGGNDSAIFHLSSTISF